MRSPFQDPRDDWQQIGAGEGETKRAVGRFFQPLCRMPLTRRHEQRLLARELDDHLVERLGIADVRSESALEYLVQVEIRWNRELVRAHMLGVGESLDGEHSDRSGTRSV